MSPLARRLSGPLAIAALLLAAACSDHPTAPGKPARPSHLFDEKGNPVLVVGSTVPGVARLEVELTGDGIEPGRFEFGNERPDELDAWGAVPVPMGTKARLTLRGWDREGRQRFAGELMVVTDGDVVRQVRAPVEFNAEGGGSALRPEAYAGSYRMSLTPSPSEKESSPDELRLDLYVHDAFGERLKLSPEDIYPFPEVEPGTLEIVYSGRDLLEVVLKLHPYVPDEKPTPTPVEDLPFLCTIDNVTCERPDPNRFDWYVKVVAEGRHTCALRASGLARCWGDDPDAQGGDATVNRLAGKRFTDIDTNKWHSCGVDDGGVIWCWGSNAQFQLGNQGASTSIPQRVAHPLGSSFVHVATGERHTCATDAANLVWCWGERNHGQLGDGNLTYGVPDQATPSQVRGIEAVAIDAGDYHTCALTVHTSVGCWGQNGTYQLLGQPAAGSQCTTYICATPVYPGNLLFSNRGVIAISASYNGTCAVEAGGALYCWGSTYAGSAGTGNGNFGVQQVDAGNTFVRPSHGALGSCALTTGGIARCWGYNTFGQLGRGFASPNSAGIFGLAPGDVTMAPGAWSQLAFGTDHACGIVEDRTAIYCWGHEGTKLGFANSADVTTPTRVTVF